MELDYVWPSLVSHIFNYLSWFLLCVYLQCFIIFGNILGAFCLYAVTNLNALQTDGIERALTLTPTPMVLSAVISNIIKISCEILLTVSTTFLLSALQIQESRQVSRYS